MRSAWSEALLGRMPAWMLSGQVPGVAVSLVQRGSPPEYLCLGTTSVGTDQPVSPRTVFQAASLGKLVFAYVSLKLCESGVLDLDAPLSGYLPDPYIADEPRLPMITARRVLSHTTGLPNWRGDAPLRLGFTPGERFGYSGEGFVYLQRVVERLTEQPLEAYMQSQWFRPLGMLDSSFLWREAYEVRMAHAHDEGRPIAEYHAVEAVSAASMLTTVADLASFAQQVLDPPAADEHHLSDRWLEAMLTPQVAITPTMAWGLGWAVLRSEQTTFWQWGDNKGYKHVAAICPARGTGIIVLTNGEQGYLVWKNVLAATVDPTQAIFSWIDSLG